MKKTTLTTIFDKYNLDEYTVGSTLWETAQEDSDEHFIAIHDGCTLYIIDTDDLESGSDGFYEGAVYAINF